MGISATAVRGAAHEAVQAAAGGAATHELLAMLPVVDLGGRPLAELYSAGAAQLDALLPEYLGAQRWFAGKGQALESARLGDVIAVPGLGSAAGAAPAGHLAMVDVRYSGAPAERYASALAAHPIDAVGDGAGLLSPLARVHAAEGEFVLADAMVDAPFVHGLVDVMRGERSLAGGAGTIAGQGGQALDDAARALAETTVAPLSLSSSNTSVRLAAPDGSSSVLKLVRRHDATLAPGTPSRALDVWKGAYLTNETSFRNTPRIFGSIDHVGADALPRTVSVLSEFAPNDGDGWAHALAEVGDVLDAARTATVDAPAVTAGLERYAAAARNHGRRLGELHVALAGGGATSEFRGAAATAEQVAARIARLRSDAGRAIEGVREAGAALPSGRTVDKLEQAATRTMDELADAAQEAAPVDLIHTHGDFHLGQVLRTGDDIQIVDLEGAPALPIGERWQRAGALGDVARQRSSYEYAAAQGLRALQDGGASADELARLRPVAERWARGASDAFVEGWREAAAGHAFVPRPADFTQALREADLSNALYETTYELGSRPDWASIPLGRLERLVTSGT